MLRLHERADRSWGTSDQSQHRTDLRTPPCCAAAHCSVLQHVVLRGTDFHAVGGTFGCSERKGPLLQLTVADTDAALALMQAHHGLDRYRFRSSLPANIQHAIRNVQHATCNIQCALCNLRASLATACFCCARELYCTRCTVQSHNIPQA